jgi:hypothetical protein
VIGHTIEAISESEETMGMNAGPSIGAPNRR